MPGFAIPPASTRTGNAGRSSTHAWSTTRVPRRRSTRTTQGSWRQLSCSASPLRASARGIFCARSLRAVTLTPLHPLPQRLPGGAGVGEVGGGFVVGVAGDLVALSEVGERLAGRRPRLGGAGGVVAGGLGGPAGEAGAGGEDQQVTIGLAHAGRGCVEIVVTVAAPAARCGQPPQPAAELRQRQLP